MRTVASYISCRAKILDSSLLVTNLPIIFKYLSASLKDSLVQEVKNCLVMMTKFYDIDNDYDETN